MVAAHHCIVISWNCFKTHNSTTQIHPQAWVDDLIIFCAPEIATKAATIVHHFFKEYHMMLNFTKTKFLAINSNLTEIVIQDEIPHTISRVDPQKYLRLLGFFYNTQLSPSHQWNQAREKAETKLSNIIKSNTSTTTKIR
eukprot:TRINITY_DN1460_c0_g1_i10.p1 TRINITY_DN1460_c0_g1~~TRINITY_DN1460_c0_g1_i10.p1  ORF type:complete len:140 (-),score=22.45 TRINITY_DN1460_c0_g1_i10:83-502(-)